MKKIKFWIKAIRQWWYWRKYEKMGCILCKERDKKKTWCQIQRHLERDKFCYRFKLGYTRKR